MNMENYERIANALGRAFANAVASNRSPSSDAERDGALVMKSEKQLVKLIAKECPTQPDKRQAWLDDIRMVLENDCSGIRGIERDTELECWKVYADSGRLSGERLRSMRWCHSRTSSGRGSRHL